MRTLSKSKIIAYRQCPKRLWLELHRPELIDNSASEASFRIGFQVGDVARKIYDPSDRGVTLDVGALGHQEAMRQSAALLAAGEVPVFEAGLRMPGAMAYADVMLPVASDRGKAWRMVEVKSATSVKDYHRDDIAVQWHIAQQTGVNLASVALAHIDTSFVYGGEGDYRGLLKEEDLTAETQARQAEVSGWLRDAQAIAALSAEPEVEVGEQFHAPFPCAFCAYCHAGEDEAEFPLSSLPRLSGNKAEALEREGYVDLRDVPDDRLNALQQRVKHSSQSGVAYFDRQATSAILATHSLPALFLDFETVSFAVPIWKGQRPYEAVPFQFSLHTLDAKGGLTHRDFLSLDGMDPRERFGRELIDACRQPGPIYVYNAAFEKRIMRQLATCFPDFAPQIAGLIERVVDLLPIARAHYYHPDQHGSWSIKAVLPTLCPELSYENLAGVQNGGMAQEAYVEAIQPTTTLERSQTIREELLDYCRLDTLAMVRIWGEFSQQ